MQNAVVKHLQFYDTQQQYAVVWRRLPHWSQAGSISFITWRTWDSIPANILQIWLAERNTWLKFHGINPAAENWRRKLRLLDPNSRREFQLQISNRWNEHLDNCHGACVLRQVELPQIVADS